MDSFLDVFDVLLDVLYFGFVYVLVGVLALGCYLVYLSLTKLEIGLETRKADALTEGATDLFVGIVFVIIALTLLRDRTGAAEWLQHLLP